MPETHTWREMMKQVVANIKKKGRKCRRTRRLEN